MNASPDALPIDDPNGPPAELTRCPHAGELRLTVRCADCLSPTFVELRALVAALMEKELAARIERASARLDSLRERGITRVVRRPSSR